MKSIISITAIFLFSFLCIQAFAQQDREVENLHHKKKNQVAAHLIDKGSYYNAINHLEKLAQEHPKNKKYLSNLADAYFLSRDYVNAEIWYAKAVELDKTNITSSLYKLAESQKYNAKYQEAKANFTLFFESKYRDSRGEKYKAYAENEIGSCDYALQHYKDTLKTNIKHLGDTINSAYSDFSPSLLDDSTIVFASLQADTVLTYRHDEVHFNHTKLYKSQLQNEEWTHPVQIEKVNTLFENSANGSLSPDGKRFYFSRCYENLKHEMICHLYVSKIDSKGNFSKAKKLPHNINKGKYSYTQPVVATHKLESGEAQEVLYFVSNKSGGKGGFDIWYTIMLPKEKFKNPMNLGKEINTIRDEITPYYDSLSGNLYFSSNFHYGFGGYDIFKSKGQMITWTKPVNASIPYNSNVDDTYYIFNKQQNKGFFVSNRAGGINLKSATCCDDIYSYIQPKQLLLVTHTYDKATNALYKNTKEIILNNSSGKQQDSLKVYNEIEGQYLYNKLIAKEIYSVNKSNSYAVESIDSGSVIENAFFNIDQDGNITNTQLAYEQDSISATKIEDDRFEIISINIFIHKDRVKTPIVIAQKAFDEKEKYFISNEKKDSIVIVKNVSKDSLEIVKNKLTDTLSTVVAKSKLNNTQKAVVKRNKIANTLRTEAEIKIDTLTAIKDIVEQTLVIDSIKIEQKTPKVNKLTNVKNSVLEIANNFSNQKIDSLVNIKNATAENTFTEIPEIEMIVHFESNDPEFIAHHKKMLDSIADFLLKNDHINLSVEAHTDNAGLKEYNLKLSSQRAKSIMEYIDQQGVSKKRVLAKWFGENDPIAPNQNEDGSNNEKNMFENRRAELKFYYNKKR